MFGLSSIAIKIIMAVVGIGAIIGAVVGFIAYERSVGAAKIKAQYEAAAQAESTRQTASLEATQARVAALTAELAKTRRSRDATVAQNDALARTLAGQRCLDAGTVKQLDRIR
jgi:flagellar basal body-associated protein FliL